MENMVGRKSPESTLGTRTVDHIRWALRACRQLSQLPPKPQRRQDAFLKSACSHFGAVAGLLIVFRVHPDGAVETVNEISLGWDAATRLSAAKDRLAPMVESPSPMSLPDLGEVKRVSRDIAFEIASEMKETPSRDAVKKRYESFGVDDFLKSTVALDEHTFESIDLLRTSAMKPFSDEDEPWLTLVHQSFDWIHHVDSPRTSKEVASLTPREQETLKYLLAGASEKEVAQHLGRSRHTVHSSVKRIYRQLNVSSRAELLSIFLESADVSTAKETPASEAGSDSERTSDETAT